MWHHLHIVSRSPCLQHEDWSDGTQGNNRQIYTWDMGEAVDLNIYLQTQPTTLEGRKEMKIH